MHRLRTLFASLLIMITPFIAACSVVELFAPDKVEAALIKIELRYGSLLDKAIDYQQHGSLNKKVSTRLTKLMDRFEHGVNRVEQARADAQNEAANLDQFIALELKTAGLNDLHADYLQAKSQALDRSSAGGEDLQQLRAVNRGKRLVWDKLQQ